MMFPSTTTSTFTADASTATSLDNFFGADYSVGMRMDPELDVLAFCICVLDGDFESFSRDVYICGVDWWTMPWCVGISILFRCGCFEESMNR